MILNRLGKKKRYAKHYIALFPEHTFYGEPFFGAGGMFFAKPKAKYNVVADLSDDVVNLFTVITEHLWDFEYYLASTPVSQSIIDLWQKQVPVCPIWRAVRFVCLSNYTFLGKGGTLKVGFENAKKIALQNIKTTYDFINKDVTFIRRDVKNFLQSIAWKNHGNYSIRKKQCFIYLDPPYCTTSNNYDDVPAWSKQDFMDMLDIYCNSGIKIAISEYDSSFVLDMAKKYELQVNYLDIGQSSMVRLEKRKKGKTEILLTNYATKKQLKIKFS